MWVLPQLITGRHTSMKSLQYPSFRQLATPFPFLHTHLPQLKAHKLEVFKVVQQLVRLVLWVVNLGGLPLALVVGVLNHLGLPSALEFRVGDHGGLPGTCKTTQIMQWLDG